MATRAEPDWAAPNWERDIDDLPVALAVSGALCAVAGAGGAVRLLDTPTGRLLARVVLPGGAASVGFSPGGGAIALAGPRGYALWRIADGAVMMRRTEAPARFAWSASDLCAVTSGGTVSVFDAAQAVEQWRPVDGAVTVDDVVWFDRGRTVAIALGGEVHAYSARGRVAAWSYPSPVRVLAGGTDGAWLCSAGDGPGVFIRGIGGTYEDLSTHGHGLIDGLSLDASGHWLAAEVDGGLTVWDLAARGGRVRPRPRRLEVRVSMGSAAWRPAARGAVIATGGQDGAVSLWDIRAGSSRRGVVPLARRFSGAPVVAVAWLGPGALLYADRAGRIAAQTVPEMAGR
ncbi:WD40 repeat domain-containing protein [Yinghuangia sp. ASG 101]|uniref:WD40 repeat domain-containing protein n=1 Tax=Yinghuangia sp. ASG 101 TaxID=2896848 RepID=UPI001E63960F|nr:WD40 repeat domain-containing protein [Yinghuangia sp. ASG 101]UGQ13661.1 WD40 repeat domain-containing protein [Yinghuangia sp. ASG 101]